MTSSTFPPTEVSSNRSFNGYQKVFEHHSHTLSCDMKFGAYFPDHKQGEKLPILFYLSGLTCTEANFIQKSGFQRFASQHRVIVVNPDTSPRGVKVEGDDETWEVGVSAGHYLDATEPKWAKHYRMYSYFVEEFVPYVFAMFSNADGARCGIFGHSMGGHGALTIGLRNPSIFKSISAFAAICNPSEASLANKAFTAYLGEDRLKWGQYDSVELSKVYAGPKRTILLDQGSADTFYTGKNLLPENLIAVKNPNIEIDFRLRDNYDHSYFYIATFIEEHIQFHVNTWEKDS